MKIKFFTIPYTIWLILFSIFPIFLIMYYSVTNSDGSFTLENYINMNDYSNAFVRSIVLSTISTFISFIIGYPTAYAILKLNKKWQKAAIAGIILQMWVSFLLITYSLMTAMESNGIISKILNLIGINCPLINTPLAVIIGMVYSCLPYMILPIYSSLSKMDHNIIEAAKDLGADKFTIFRRITLPLSSPGILSGFLMVFAPDMSSFIISKMLGGNENILIGEIIELKFLGSEFNPYSGSAISLVLMIFIFLVIGNVKCFLKHSG